MTTRFLILLIFFAVSPGWLLAEESEVSDAERPLTYNDTYRQHGGMGIHYREPFRHHGGMGIHYRLPARHHGGMGVHAEGNALDWRFFPPSYIYFVARPGRVVHSFALTPEQEEAPEGEESSEPTVP
jgi:hypothetical protein